MDKSKRLQKPPSTPVSLGSSAGGSGKKVQAPMTNYFKSTPKSSPLTSPPSPATPLGTPSPLVIEDDDDDDVQFVKASMEPAKKVTVQNLSIGSATKTTPFSTPKSTPVNTKNGKASSARPNAAKRPRKSALDSPEEPDHDSDQDPEFKEIDQGGESETDSEGEDEVDEDSEEESGLEEEEDNFQTPQKRKRSAPPAGSKAKRVALPKGSAGKAGKKPAKLSKKLKSPADDAMDEDDEARNEDDEPGEDKANVVKAHKHEYLPFLQPDKIRDKNGVLHKELLEKGLAPRTVRVPTDFLQSCTPALKQWWEMKSENYDCILFFKLGKFYEMYNGDADTAVRELGLAYMRGEQAHCGFPEAAFSRYANQLIEKGYKVIRVEQTMTPAQFKQSDKKGAKALPREIIRIHTPGTMSINTLECETDGHYSSSQNTSCLLAICEKIRIVSGAEQYEYGICLLYPGPGTFLVGQFVDDRYHSRLRTLLAQHAPNEILLERGKGSPTLRKILQNHADQARMEHLLPVVEFYECRKAIEVILEREYFGSIMTPEWPSALAGILELGGTLPSAKSEYELAIRALGGTVWYLKRCEIDFDLMSLKNFELYMPADQSRSDALKEALKPKHMVLDGVTLLNLDVVSSQRDNASCLLARINRCKTKFGARLLKEWVLSPLYRIADILERQAAIADLSIFKQEDDKLYKSVQDVLKGLPDLERLLSKVHIVGSFQRKKVHPETRAVMFDDAVYSKRKIKDFLVTIRAFRNIANLVAKISAAFANSKSDVLRRIVTPVDGPVSGVFPDLAPILEVFLQAFDAKQAEEEGVIKPKKGVDEEYDAAKSALKDVEEWFEDHRVEQAKIFQCQIKYFGAGKHKYQLELPESVCKKISDSYELKSAKKGFKRYWSAEIPEKLEELEAAEARREAAMKDCTRRVFEKFDFHYADWMKAVKCMGTLDVLFALEEYSSNLSPGCTPIFKEATPEFAPFITIRDGHHPLVVATFSGGEFIPNDVFIGTGDPDNAASNGCLTLVTGPNMGGKSTLMRQVGLIAILAQLGSNVPAVFCEMTPVDRIFTRIGASDNLLGGESTFFVELSETSSILQHATQNSLVLVDELGRGTATFDGTAVAAAVLKDLALRLKCRTLFSTHYHSLVERFSHFPSVKLGHMACLVENDNDDDPTQEAITFLYKFIPGDCPKSYGFNAARLAGIPDKIIQRAREKANELEKLMNLGKMNLDS